MIFILKNAYNFFKYGLSSKSAIYVYKFIVFVLFGFCVLCAFGILNNIIIKNMIL